MARRRIRLGLAVLTALAMLGAVMPLGVAAADQCKAKLATFKYENTYAEYIDSKPAGTYYDYAQIEAWGCWNGSQSWAQGHQTIVSAVSKSAGAPGYIGNEGSYPGYAHTGPGVTPGNEHFWARPVFDSYITELHGMPNLYLYADGHWAADDGGSYIGGWPGSVYRSFVWNN